MSKKPLAVVTSVLMLALTACTEPLPPPENFDRPSLTFDSQTDTISFDTETPDWESVDSLLSRNNAGYGDRLVVPHGAVAVEAARRYAPLRITIVPGVLQDQIAFRRTLVNPPSCGRWEAGFDDEGDNQLSPNYGCADLSNLARMIADPNDLVSGRSGNPLRKPVPDLVGINAMRDGSLVLDDTISDETTGD